MGARIGSRRSPHWSCRLEELSSEAYFCPPLSHSVTLGKTLPALILRFLICPCLYSAVSIRLGASSEFTGGKMREGLVVPDPGSLICWVWLWAGASDQPAHLVPKAGRFWACREQPSLSPGDSRCTARGPSLGHQTVGSSTFVPVEAPPAHCPPAASTWGWE